ncbi:MAG TPA: hypothetical protein VHE33_10475 [Acidobacteriaceae bacterium]|nr:hypothetical protein [Acidobacteriaceae bacterium]
MDTDTDTAQITVPVRDRTVIVEVPKDSRLEQLLCIAEVTKAKADAAQDAYDELKDGILAELVALHPDLDIKGYDIPAGPMWPGFTYTWQSQFFLPAPKIREHLPPVYEAFKQEKSFWRFGIKKKSKR